MLSDVMTVFALKSTFLAAALNLSTPLKAAADAVQASPQRFSPAAVSAVRSSAACWTTECSVLGKDGPYAPFTKIVEPYIASSILFQRGLRVAPYGWSETPSRASLAVVASALMAMGPAVAEAKSRSMLIEGEILVFNGDTLEIGPVLIQFKWSLLEIFGRGLDFPSPPISAIEGYVKTIPENLVRSKKVIKNQFEIMLSCCRKLNSPHVLFAVSRRS